MFIKKNYEEITMEQHAKNNTERLNAILNSHYGISNISNSTYEEVGNFLFLWNMFEREFFATHYRHKIPKHFSSLKIEQSTIDEILDYFKKRYMNSQYFEALNLQNPRINGRSINIIQIFKDVLCNKVIESEQILFTINSIIYRYRCNLFHGIKEIKILRSQIDNFYYANKYMLACLEAKFSIK